MKRFLYILLTVVLCLLLTLLMLLAVARSSEVQTAALRVLTQELSRGLQTEVRVGRLDYKFPNRLEVNGIYIEDRMGDTLLWADTLRARFDAFGLAQNRIAFRQVTLRNVLLNAYRQPDSLMNYQFLLDLLPRNDNPKPLKQTVEVHNVALRNVRLRYNEWRVNPLEADLTLNRFSQDSLDAEVTHLALREAGGFVLNEMQTRAVLSRNGARLERLHVLMPASEIALSGAMQRPSEREMFDFSGMRDDQIDLCIDKAELTLRDIARFVPAVKNVRGRMRLSTCISGRVGDLTARDIALDYKDYKVLRGNVSFYGLPDLDTSYVHAVLTDLMLDRALLQDFLSDLNKRPYQLPAEVARLGKMHYSGILDGRLDSLTLDGTFTSRIGSITTKGSLLASEGFERLRFSGRVQTQRFALGRLLNSAEVGNLSMQAQVTGSVGRDEPLAADLDARINAIGLRGYTYRNLHIDGLYSRQRFSGRISMADDNLSFRFDGLADLGKAVPEYDFSLLLNRMRLGPLNLSEQYADMAFSGRLTVRGSGNRLDNINGRLSIDSLRVERTDGELLMRQLDILAETGRDQPTSLKIQSDFLNANFAGAYRYSELPMAVQRIVGNHLPRMLSQQTRDRLAATAPSNEIEYYAYFKNLNEVTAILDLPYRFDRMPTVKGFLNERSGQFAVQAGVPSFRTTKQQIDDITLSFDNRDDRLNLSFYAYKHASKTPAGKKMGDLEAFLKATARTDSLYLDLTFQNTDSARTVGTFSTATHFSQYAGKPLVDVHLLPSTIMLADSVWTIGDSHLVYTAADTTLQVNGFRIGNERHFIFADGLASSRQTDSIHISLSEIVLDYLLEYTNVKQSVVFGGAVTGKGTAYGLFGSPMFEAEVWMNEASLNNSLLGDAHATARLNRERKTIDIMGTVTERGDTVATVEGVVNPAIQRWDLNIYPDSVNLGFISYWTQPVFGQVGGRGFGWVHVYGIGPKTWVEGKAYARDASIGIDMLGTSYHFSDSVTLLHDAILFRDITLYDSENNPLHLDGAVRHDSLFRDFRYELGLTCRNALVMDLPPKEQDMFYGHVYATGGVDIKGNEQECNILANARTDRNTTFFFSTATATTARDNSFITFVDHRKVEPKPKTTDSAVPQKRKQNTKVLVDLQLEGTPDAEINIVIDPKTGDRLTGRGSGNVRMTYDVNANDVKLFGTYTLESGTFNFTFENLIRKEFRIRQGSTITFTGDPLNLIIDASAVYTTTASLRDLFGTDFSSVATNRTSVPVNCIIYLRENILNPLISFGLELPQSDESINSQVKGIINTDEMMMRQIMYLLIFNRFYTPEYLQTETRPGLSETYSLLSSTVTGQINNWLRRLTNNFTLGFNIRTDGFDSSSSQEYETQFQYVHNNRLIINGNFGYRYNDISNQPVFGNLDVEYLLTPSGMFRAKAYTHMVDKYSLRTANTVQGVGLMFKYDFNGSDGKSSKAGKAKRNVKSRRSKRTDEAEAGEQGADNQENTK
ncbi:MAG: translocation/assembly module TamB domain-containing protein [Paludibacteraceae bacterium]|nr:translocation/assembly module TamB domain-containing protein [Paludibacteraceae bacterium]